LAMGAPTKFKESFCEMLIKHMTAGADFRSFAGLVGVTEATIHNWRKEHKSFAYAYEIAKEKCYLWWQIQSLKTSSSKDRMDTGMFVINMRNRFKWATKDKDDDRPSDDTTVFSEAYGKWRGRQSER